MLLVTCCLLLVKVLINNIIFNLVIIFPIISEYFFVLYFQTTSIQEPELINFIFQSGIIVQKGNKFVVQPHP